MVNQKNKKDKGHVYDKRAIFICWRGNPIRKIAIWLCEWAWFDRFVIFIIFLNSLSLAVYDYEDADNKTLRNKIIEQSGLFFTIFFTFECTVKIVALGFIIHKNAYLRDGWNWIDFIVVVIGLVE